MIVGVKRKLSVIIKQYLTTDDILKTFKLLWPYILQQWKAYMVLLLLLFIDIFLTLAFAWFFGNITDAAIHNDFGKMKWLVLIGGGLLLLSISSTFLNIYFETVATNGVKNGLKSHLFKHILLLPVGNISKLHSGELLSHFTNDIHSIDGIIGRSLINLIKLPLTYILVFIYLVHSNWKLSLLSLFVAPIAILAGAFFGLLLRRNSRSIYSLIGKTNSLLNETFQGIFVIRSFTLENMLFKKYVGKTRELYSLELNNARLQGYFQTGGYIVSFITYLLSLCLGAFFISNKIMSVGALLTFLNLVNHLIYPLTGLAGQWAGFQKSVSAVERITKILEQPLESVELPSFLPFKPHLNSIQFQNITFSYDGQKNIFDQFHLQIPAGKIVAIVGRSGAGKSTLFNLLQGFFKPESGKIWIDRVAIDEFSPSELRSLFAYVPQEPFLFDGTIRENLLLARPGIREVEMIRAAENAKIHDFVMSLPRGYDTEIGERGMALSGGQKQRIAIARALLKDTPILLLDEATSALDNETEYQVKEALDQLMRNRTTLVIAHRLSTIRNADVIVVLDRGKIVQMGCHEELIAADGLYRKLYHMQFSTEMGAKVV